MNQYPAWQKSIREAQAKATAEQAQKEQEEAAAMLATRYKNGQELKHVLSLFGIEGEPDIDVIVIDNYRFKLYTEGRRGDSAYYFYHDEISNVDTIGFHLLVARILPEHGDDGFEWHHTRSWLNIGRKHITEEEKTDWFISLSTSIDEIDRAYDKQYPQYLEYKARQFELVSPAPVVKEITIAQQIEYLVRQIVVDELNNREESAY